MEDSYLILCQREYQQQKSILTVYTVDLSFSSVNFTEEEGGKYTTSNWHTLNFLSEWKLANFDSSFFFFPEKFN